MKVLRLLKIESVATLDHKYLVVEVYIHNKEKHVTTKSAHKVLRKSLEIRGYTEQGFVDKFKEALEMSGVDISPFPNKPNCFECIHRRNVPNNTTYSMCAHPSMQEIAINSIPLHDFAAIGYHSGGVPIFASSDLMFIIGHELGVRKGLFKFPYNFDPVWLENCDGFEAMKPNINDTDAVANTKEE